MLQTLVDYFDCSKLLSLPDISKWNTFNIKDFSEMFMKCSSLISLPDISKWNTYNGINLSFLIVHQYNF